jgi:hypothetical protein
VPAPDEHAALTRAGLKVISTVENILSGVLESLEQLEAVAALPFVREIELSRRLYAEHYLGLSPRSGAKSASTIRGKLVVRFHK